MLSFVNMIVNVNINNIIIQILVDLGDYMKIKLLNIYVEKFCFIKFENVIVFKKK